MCGVRTAKVCEAVRRCWIVRDNNPKTNQWSRNWDGTRCGGGRYTLVGSHRPVDYKRIFEVVLGFGVTHSLRASQSFDNTGWTCFRARRNTAPSPIPIPTPL